MSSGPVPSEASRTSSGPQPKLWVGGWPSLALLGRQKCLSNLHWRCSLCPWLLPQALVSTSEFPLFRRHWSHWFGAYLLTSPPLTSARTLHPNEATFGGSGFRTGCLNLGWGLFQPQQGRHQNEGNQPSKRTQMRIKNQELLCRAAELRLRADMLIGTETKATWVLFLTQASARKVDKTEEAAKRPSWRRRHAQTFTRLTANLVCPSAYRPLTGA